MAVKYYNFDIVFAEIPDETTLALNITNCPNRCPGCHSLHLQQDIGHELNRDALAALLGCYGRSVTCICFMGGDAAPVEVARLARMVKELMPAMKTGWYSGCDVLAEGVDPRSYDYIKIGRWDSSRGPLSSPTTNQHLYRIGEDGSMEDITKKFWRK